MKTNRVTRIVVIVVATLLINMASPFPLTTVSANNALQVSVAQRLDLTGSELRDFEENIEIQELTGKALARAIKNAQRNTKYQTAIEHLQSEGFVLRDGSVLGEEIRVGAGRDKRIIVVLIGDYQYTDENFARLIYISDSQGDVRVGFGLIEQHSDMQTVHTYEVQGNNEIVEESLIEIHDDGTLIAYIDGQEYVLTNTCPQGEEAGTTAASSNCIKCLQICYSLYGLGCGLGGVLACALICAPIGGILCPLICGAVYVILCLIGGGTCWTICATVLGYCP